MAPRGVALGAALGAVVARTALAPIDRFTRRTEAIAGDPDPSHRIDVSAKDELGRLARSFNATLDALERSVEAQRQLVADASHELRTPIASLRANIQTLEHADRLPAAELESLRADIVAELDELTALVADIVELARGAKPDEAEDDVRLDQIVESVAHRARGRANGIAFDVSTEPTVVRGEPDRIQRAVSNLLDNALKWSPGGGRVEIDLAGGRLSVRDHGPGFQEADLPHVFDRFYRAGRRAALPGSGLGLAIVRQAAEANGGERRGCERAGRRRGRAGVVRDRRSGHRLKPRPSLLDRVADPAGQRRVLALEVLQHRPAEDDQPERRLRDHVGVPARALEQAHLAEEVARAELVEVLAARDHPRRALLDHEELMRRLALATEHLAGRHVDLVAAHREEPALLARETRKQLDAPKRGFVHLLLHADCLIAPTPWQR